MGKILDIKTEIRNQTVRRFFISENQFPKCKLLYYSFNVFSSPKFWCLRMVKTETWMFYNVQARNLDVLQCSGLKLGCFTMFRTETWVSGPKRSLISVEFDLFETNSFYFYSHVPGFKFPSEKTFLFCQKHILVCKTSQFFDTENTGSVIHAMRGILHFLRSWKGWTVQTQVRFGCSPWLWKCFRLDPYIFFGSGSKK